VLYLVAEGVRGTKKRVRAWEKSMGREMTGVLFLPIAVQSKNGAQWDAFVELVRELKPALIVIDTQARVTVGVEENSNTEMGEFVDRAERLRMASRRLRADHPPHRTQRRHRPRGHHARRRALHHHQGHQG
jgi:hypothetical protein